MLPFPSLPWFELARFRRSRLTRAALVAVAVVPLFYGVLYVWANWDPVGNLDRVQAAVVNADQPVTVTGADGKKQTVPLGRVLAGRLTGSTADNNFDWTLTSASDASSGLSSGRFAAVVTIPPSFSKAATSTSSPDGADAVQAKINIETNDAQNYLSGTIASAVGAAATGALNAQVSGTYLDNLYLGFSTLHDQIGSAADGASKLSDGASQLSDGVKKAGDGADQLTVGLKQLAAGTSGLPAQARQLNSGAQQLSSGSAQLSRGLTSLDGGLQKLAFGTSSLPAQTSLLDSGARQVASGASQLSSGAGNVSTGAGFVSSGLTNLQTQMRALSSSCAASGASAAYCAQVSALASGVSPLVTGASGVSQGAAFVQNGASQLSSGAAQLRSGTKQLASAAPTLSSGIASAASGAQKLDAGAMKLAGGAAQLSSGTAQFAGAAPALSSGISQAASGSAQLSAGTSQLSSGASQLDDGANRLANGLSDGAKQIPSYTSDERANLSKVAATPVVADTSRVNAVQSNGAGLAPYFMALALWVGAMATFMLLRALSPRTLASTASSWRVALSAYLPGAVLVTVQAVLLVLVLHFLVGLDPSHLALTLLFAVLIALTYAAMNQALIALFGGAGRFLALILISLQLTTAGGTYPIDTAPAFFSFLHTYLPMTYAVDGLRGLIAGGSGALGRDVLVLLIYAVGAGLLTVLAAARQRTWTLTRLHATAIV